MPLSLLDSQLSTLEELPEVNEHGVLTIDANNLGPTELFGIAFAKLNRAHGI
jgi:gluconate kinase